MDSSNPSADQRFTAVKTEPFGHTMLLPTEQVPEYEALLASINQQFRPESDIEKHLAQNIVSHLWRLRRLENLEKGLCLLAQRNMGTAYRGEEELRKSTERIDPRFTATYDKQFKYIVKQTRFLQKRVKHDTDELNRMLQARPKPKYNGLFLVNKNSK